MPKKTYTTMPVNYPVCLHSDCPLAGTCLHGMAYASLLEHETYLRLINPRQCSATADCQFYRNNQPVTYARGFTNFQRQMYPAQYQQFSVLLISHFGRNAFYERRRGATALSPKEQAVVLDVLREVGITQPFQFDHYEDHINWYD